MADFSAITIGENTYDVKDATARSGLAGKQNTLTAGTGINIVGDVISATGGGGISILPHLIVISETESAVTATKGQTVITATETSTGHFECDLPEFGTWTIDSILGGDDAQVSLVVDTVKVYTVDDSHFHSDITVKYPSGATCNLTGQGESYYATGSPYTFTVHHAGQYTITVVHDGQTFTETVTVTTTGETISEVVPSPSSVPANDINWWLFFGDVSGTFLSLSEILANSTALSLLMASTDAVDYLVRCTNWISDICGNQSAMSYIGLNNYCANTLLADSDWLNGIANSEYVESVLSYKIPTFSSYTAPSGTFTYSRDITADGYNYGQAWKAFDGNSTTYWQATTDSVSSSGQYIQYLFANSEKIKVIKCKGRYFDVYLSKDGTNWDKFVDSHSSTSAIEITETILTNDSYVGVKAIGTGPLSTSIYILQCYGREDV